jgi:hypothetical protein
MMPWWSWFLAGIGVTIAFEVVLWIVIMIVATVTQPLPK